MGVSDGLCGSESPRLSVLHMSVPNATKIRQRLSLKKIILLLGRSLSCKLLMSVLGSITVLALLLLSIAYAIACKWREDFELNEIRRE